MLGIDVVTADGELVHASEDSHADLYWAARGSGPGFFGVVTSFHLKLHDLPAVFVHTTYVFPASVFDELMHWAQALLPTLDTRVEPVIVGTRIATVAVRGRRQLRQARHAAPGLRPRRPAPGVPHQSRCDAERLRAAPVTVTTLARPPPLATSLNPPASPVAPR